MNDTNDIGDKFKKDCQETLDRAKREFDKKALGWEKQVNKVEKLSMENFTAWRDYLHKYYTSILVLIGATGILQSDKFVNIYFKLGVYSSLFGILIGYTIINLYFYLERRWFQAQEYLFFCESGDGKLFKHPKNLTDNIVKSIILHELDNIEKLEMELAEAKKNKDNEKIEYYKETIKNVKKIIFSLKFTGQQFGLLEQIWVGGVLVSLIFSLAGIVTVFININ